MSPVSSPEAIVYLSVSVRPMTSAMLEDLLLECRRLNTGSGVTGALLYGDGMFLQYFEGEPVAMAETWARIRASRQHTRIVEMLNEPIARREFPDWVMALARPTSSELLALSTASWVISNSNAAARGRDSVGMTLLRNFWNQRARH